MFKNLSAIVAPNSFNLANYLAKSKTYTKISKAITKAVFSNLDKQSLTNKREGNCVTSTASTGYSGTIVSITDETLAKTLYTAINRESFDDELSDAYSKFTCFENLKFFVNKKKQAVVFVYYQCELDHSSEFLYDVFDKLEYIRSLFSTDEYNINVNYETFFENFLTEYPKTSFLTAFFTSIIAEDYPFSSSSLYNIATTIIDSDHISHALKTTIPGMYIEHLDRFFKDTKWPRSICINLLRLRFNNDAFSNYSEFFKHYETNETAEGIEDLFVDKNFVFDESLVENSLTVIEETEEFVTFSTTTEEKSNWRVLIKVKDTTRISEYLQLLNECVNFYRLDKASIIPNCAKDCYYLYFLSLYSDTLKSFSMTCHHYWMAKLVQHISQSHFPFAFKPNTDVLDCLMICGDKLYLNPCCITKLDFEKQNAELDTTLLLLQMLKVHVEATKVDIKRIYEYDFMKVLSPLLAKQLIDYLTDGTYTKTDANVSDNVLTYANIANVVFIDNVDLKKPDYMSFFTTVASNPKVQEIIDAKSSYAKTDYLSSPDCLQYIRSIGLDLCNGTLMQLFADTSDIRLRPVRVIIDKGLVKNGKYQIIGVEWNKSGLRTLQQFVAEEEIDTKVYYLLITSLYALRNEHSWEINETNLKNMLVDFSYNVFLNCNAYIGKENYEGLSNEDYFNHLVRIFSILLDANTLAHLQRFTFKALCGKSYDIRKVASLMTLCKEHKLYHLSGDLCSKCKEIYEVVKIPTTSRCLHAHSPLSFYASNNNQMIACRGSIDYSIGQDVVDSVKFGLSKGFFSKFFFKPKKLAYADGKPFGVMFDQINFANLLPIEEFTNMQRLQVVLVMYKKLLPYVLDGSFIVDSKSIFESIAMHKDYKGQLFILLIPFINCKAIYEEDAKAIETTKKLFSQFLVQYILGDQSLKVASKYAHSGVKELIDDIKNLHFSESILRRCINTSCAVHHVPFSSRYSICPLCLADGIDIEKMCIKSPSYYRHLQDETAAFEGGEATLYDHGPHSIQKIFKPQVDLALKSKILGKALQKIPMLLKFNKEHQDIKFVTIGEVLYESDGKTIKLKGFVQKRIENAFKISSLKDKEFVTSHNYSRSDILDILIKVCIGIEFLHSIGVYIGDLNGGNILIKGKTVYFIDPDGMSYDDVKNLVYTDLYIYPPSAENKNITKDDDWYSLAIQAFYYLTYSHPFRGISDNKKVPANEVERMKLKLSVLGNHSIKVPNISIGWDFMSKSLIDFFLDTFEGNKRESMRSVLEAYRLEMSNSPTTSPQFQELTRKFDCQFALSHNSYIDTSGYLVWCEKRMLHFSSGNVQCNVTGDNIILFTQYKTVILNDKYGNICSFDAVVSGEGYWAVNDKLFCTSSNRLQFMVRTIDKTTGNEVATPITRATTNEIVDFLVTDTNKFVFLEKESANCLAIYCNLEKLTSFDVTSLIPYSSYIFHDKISGNYLVLVAGNNKTMGIVIHSDGSFNTFTLDVQIGKACCFYKNTLYYLLNDKVCLYNVINGKASSFTSYCASKGVLLERQQNRFVICANDKTYVCIKH